MIEKVNPSHPDKVADRIAGAIVDLAYLEEENPKVAVEVLIGHGVCHIITEASVIFEESKVQELVKRITKQNDIKVILQQVPQDIHLANNQAAEVRCGDNGIFKGVPLTKNEKDISKLAKEIYKEYPYDGKYILTDDECTICQSNAETLKLEQTYGEIRPITWINPLGDWTGGTDVDTGATNRKLGSDMAQSVTGGGLHGKDLSKADVSVNIYCFLRAQELDKTITAHCSIGDNAIRFFADDEFLEALDYSEIVQKARDYIFSEEVGGFEKFAEWGLY